MRKVPSIILLGFVLSGCGGVYIEEQSFVADIERQLANGKVIRVYNEYTYFRVTRSGLGLSDTTAGMKIAQRALTNWCLDKGWVVVEEPREPFYSNSDDSWNFRDFCFNSTAEE